MRVLATARLRRFSQLSAGLKFPFAQLASKSAAAAATEVARFFEQVLREEPPRLLQAYLEVQQLRSHDILAPDDASLVTAGLHPLLVPLTRGVGIDGREVIRGLMRMPMADTSCRWPLVEAALGSSAVGPCTTTDCWRATWQCL